MCWNKYSPSLPRSGVISSGFAGEVVEFVLGSACPALRSLTVAAAVRNKGTPILHLLVCLAVVDGGVVSLLSKCAGRSGGGHHVVDFLAGPRRRGGACSGVVARTWIFGSVLLVVCSCCFGILGWRSSFFFPVAWLAGGLENVFSSHLPRWAFLRCLKPSVAMMAMRRRCVQLELVLPWFLSLAGDNDDLGLDCVLENRCEVLLVISLDHVVFSFSFGVVCNVCHCY